MKLKQVLADDNTIILACSKCNRQKVVDMNPYLKEKKSDFKVKCKCGHSWSVELEKRHHVRKPTNLPGDYVIIRNGKKIGNGHMMVVDISLKGIKIKLNRKKDIQKGDSLEVDFTLDNKPKTIIKRTVQVINIDFPFVGTAFEKIDRPDPDIGFYLQEIKAD